MEISTMHFSQKPVHQYKDDDSANAATTHATVSIFFRGNAGDHRPEKSVHTIILIRRIFKYNFKSRAKKFEIIGTVK